MEMVLHEGIMSTLATKFELTLIPDIRNDPNYITFQTTLESLSVGSLKYYQVYGSDNGQGLIIHGIVLPVNGAAALAALVTLNTTQSTPVTCASYPVTLQP
jgi:hypothetical protein